MKIRNHKRLFALLLVLALVVGIIPGALADNEPDISAAESAKETLVDCLSLQSPTLRYPAVKTPLIQLQRIRGVFAVHLEDARFNATIAA